jgi:hypothetical protein
MNVGQTRRVDLLIRSGCGAGIVLQRRAPGGALLPVNILPTLASARLWIEAHYTGVRWDGQRLGSALMGALVPDTLANLEQHAANLCALRSRAPLTFSSDIFRAYLPQLIAGPTGLLIVQYCEELERELGSWKPFLMLHWRQAP